MGPIRDGRRVSGYIVRRIKDDRNIQTLASGDRYVFYAQTYTKIRGLRLIMYVYKGSSGGTILKLGFEIRVWS